MNTEKSEKLFRAIGQLSDSTISEVESHVNLTAQSPADMGITGGEGDKVTVMTMQTEKPKKPGFLRFATVAAALALTIGIGAIASPYLFNPASQGGGFGVETTYSGDPMRTTQYLVQEEFPYDSPYFTATVTEDLGNNNYLLQMRYGIVYNNIEDEGKAIAAQEYSRDIPVLLVNDSPLTVGMSIDVYLDGQLVVAECDPYGIVYMIEGFVGVC